MISNLIDPYGTLSDIRARLTSLFLVSITSTLVSIPVGFGLGVRFLGGFLILLVIPAALCLAKSIKALNGISLESSEGFVRFYKGHFLILCVTVGAAIIDCSLNHLPAAYSYTSPKLAISVGHRDLFAGVIALQLFAAFNLIRASRDASRMKAGQVPFAPAT